jgi:regulator of PEP synthase PpsR (kinase-PPPase family)
MSIRISLVRENMQEQIGEKERNAYLLLEKMQTQVDCGEYSAAKHNCLSLLRTLESVNEIANELADMEDEE